MHNIWINATALRQDTIDKDTMVDSTPPPPEHLQMHGAIYVPNFKEPVICPVATAVQTFVISSIVVAHLAKMITRTINILYTLGALFVVANIVLACFYIAEPFFVLLTLGCAVCIVVCIIMLTMLTAHNLMFFVFITHVTYLFYVVTIIHQHKIWVSIVFTSGMFLFISQLYTLMRLLAQKQVLQGTIG